MTESAAKIPVSVIILTRDEASNIAACLEQLKWAGEIILVDSNSVDETIANARAACPGIRVFQNAFQDFGQQRNWALDSTQPRFDWILFVDADERITESCANAIRQSISNPGDRVGYFLCYRNIFMGRWIKRCTQFPSWQLRLLRKGKVRYRKEGHGQREMMDGPAGYIDVPYDHLDLSKGMEEWIWRHTRYAIEESGLLIRMSTEPLKPSDFFRTSIERRRFLKRISARLGGSPFAWFVYLYFLRLGFLDGKPGLIFCLLRSAQFAQVKAMMAEAKQLGARRLPEAT